MELIEVERISISNNVSLNTFLLPDFKVRKKLFEGHKSGKGPCFLKDV